MCDSWGTTLRGLRAPSALSSPRKPRLAIDATGVGRAVVDLFTEATSAARLFPIRITAGLSIRSEGGEYVPKVVLAGLAQPLSQTGRLKVVPGLKLAEAMKAELLAFQSGASRRD